MLLKNRSKSINKKFILYSFLTLNISTIFGMEDQSLSNDINSNYDNSSITSHNQINNNWVKFPDYSECKIFIENNFKKNFLINYDDNNKHGYLNENIDKKNNSENSNNIDVNNLNNNNGNKNILKTEKEIDNKIDVNNLLINKYNISDICKIPINNNKNNETKNKLLKKKKYRGLELLSKQGNAINIDTSIVNNLITCFKGYCLSRLNTSLTKNKELKKELENNQVSQFKNFLNLKKLSFNNIPIFLGLPIKFFCSTSYNRRKNIDKNAIIVKIILENSDRFKKLNKIISKKCSVFFTKFVESKKYYKILKKYKEKEIVERIICMSEKIIEGGFKRRNTNKDNVIKNNIIKNIIDNFIDKVGYKYITDNDKKYIENILGIKYVQEIEIKNNNEIKNEIIVKK